jgi:N-acetylmuramic acid 6-phosphate etherase
LRLRLDKWYFFGINLPMEKPMTQSQTEQRHAQCIGLDMMEDRAVLSLLASGQAEAAASVAEAVDSIALGAAVMADSIRAGGRLIYVAAGSSGLMALADALEIPQTFGIAQDRIVVLLAGGMSARIEMRGGPEDDAVAAVDDLMSIKPGKNDCVLAITASGSTPDPLAAAQKTRELGARTIGMANNSGAPLFDVVDVGICLPTPPEVLAGSTRMGAGTAQKIALNMLSTMMAIRLGHVHDGYMINVMADNDKLRLRARGIVAEVAGVTAEIAASALAEAGGAVKPAVLIAAGADSALAQDLLARHDGVLRPALEELRKR